MKRKERSVLLRIINALSALVFAASCLVMFVWGVSVAALSGAALAFCCIAAPVVITGEGLLEVVVGTLETFADAFMDAVIGVFEAISDLFSGVG